MEEGKNKVIHFKKNCISCGACAAINPEFWEMDPEGLAQLKGAENKGDHWELEVDTEAAKVSNQEAADVCPVNIIHVKKKE